MDNITAVKQKIDIIELVNTHVQLKKAGKNYKGLCPFHSEKTGSFMVSPDLQRYRCFGCGKSGDIFNFIMDTEGVDFAEALKILADKAGVTLQYEDSEKSAKEKSRNQKIIEMNKIAAIYYQQILLKHPFGEVARKYLQKRGITDKTISEFKLGYAPKSWDSLSRFLASKGYSVDEIIVSGLGKKREYRNSSGSSTSKSSETDSTFDMFRGRLMFPLFDHLSRVIGFAGRSLDDEQMPKYMNSPETPIFHKEQFLFGINFAKTPIKQKNEAIIVEGEFDMISPYQEGIKNIVASKGTALTLPQSKLLKRYCDTVIIIFDSDQAGIEAAIRGIDAISSSGLNIKIAPIPEEYKDPDEMVKKDKKAFIEITKNSLPIWDYYFLYANEKFKLDKVFERKKASDFLLGKIRLISDKVIQSEYIKKFATLFDVTEETVIQSLQKADAEAIPVTHRNSDIKDIKNVIDESVAKGYPSSEIYLLALLVKADKDKLILYLDSIEEEYFTDEVTRDLFHEIQKGSKSKKGLDAKEFYAKLENSHPETYSLFEQVYLLDLEEQLADPDDLEEEITGIVNRLKRSFLQRKLKDITSAIKKAEAVSNSKDIDKLQKEVQEYSQELAKLPST